MSFLGGLCLGSFLRYLPISIITLLVLCALGLTWYERQGKLVFHRSLVLYACLLCGVGYWTVSESPPSTSPLLAIAGDHHVRLHGVIAEPVQHAPGRMTMLVDLMSIEKEATQHRVQGTLRLTWRDPDITVYRGDVLTVTARLRAPFGTRNPGGFDYGAYLRQRGVDAVAVVRGADRIHVRSPDPFKTGSLGWNWIDRWRDDVRQAVLSSLNDPARSLLLGMIVGEQRYIDQEVRDDFMTTGTVHIISISGSHLGLLAFLSFLSVRGVTRRMPVSWLEWLSCRITPKQLAVMLTIPLVVFYTVLSGAHVATVRSLVMIVLYLMAVWFGHGHHLFTALGLSACLTTLVNPMVIYDLSFQLSYVSVLAIAIALHLTHRSEETRERIESSGEKIKKWLSSYFLVSCAATLATLPLVAYYFNQVAWLGVFANMVVVPFIGLCVVPLGLLSAILVLVFDLDHLPFAWINQAILDSGSTLVGFFANMPGAEWHVASPAYLAMVGFYTCLLLALLCHQKIWRWASTTVVIVLIIWWVWSPRQIFDDETLRVTFLDVGQGDATLLELPDGQTVLIDGGAAYERWDMGRMVVGPYLWDRGIRTIDHLIATHPQLDHVGGLTWVINHFDIHHFWTNGIHRAEPFYQRLHHTVKEKNLTEQVAWAGRNLLKESPCQLHSLNPPRSGHDLPQAVPARRTGAELNNQSIVLSLTCEGQSMLFTADAEVEALTRMIPHPAVQTATLVKIPHHGAKSSFNADWLDHVRATVAVVSAGQWNRYGHPAPAVLEHYDNKGMAVYRTDHDGAIVVIYNMESFEPIIQTTNEHVLLVLNRAGNILTQEIANLQRLWRNWVGAA